MTTLPSLQPVLSPAVRLVNGLGPRNHVYEHMKYLHCYQLLTELNTFLCIVLFMAKILLTSRTFSFQSRFFQIILVYDLLHQDSMTFHSLERSLDDAAHMEWKSLLAELRLIADTRSFKEAIKTFTFVLDVHWAAQWY